MNCLLALGQVLEDPAWFCRCPCLSLKWSVAALPRWTRFLSLAFLYRLGCLIVGSRISLELGRSSCSSAKWEQEVFWLVASFAQLLLDVTNLGWYVLFGHRKCRLPGDVRRWCHFVVRNEKTKCVADVVSKFNPLLTGRKCPLKCLAGESEYGRRIANHFRGAIRFYTGGTPVYLATNPRIRENQVMRPFLSRRIAACRADTAESPSPLLIGAFETCRILRRETSVYDT